MRVDSGRQLVSWWIHQALDELSDAEHKQFRECFELAKNPNNNNTTNEERELLQDEKLKELHFLAHEYKSPRDENLMSFGAMAPGPIMAQSTYDKELSDEQKTCLKLLPCASRLGERVLVQIKQGSVGTHLKHSFQSVDQYLRSSSFGFVRRDVDGRCLSSYLCLYDAIRSLMSLEDLAQQEWTGFTGIPLLSGQNLPKTSADFATLCRKFTAQVVRKGGRAAEFITYELATSYDYQELPNCFLMCIARECAKKKYWVLLSELILLNGE